MGFCWGVCTLVLQSKCAGVACRVRPYMLGLQNRGFTCSLYQDYILSPYLCKLEHTECSDGLGICAFGGRIRTKSFGFQTKR